MSDQSFNEERLGKIVALAKRGEGGEKTNAIRILKQLCEKHSLDFDELMSGGERVEEFEIEYKTLVEKEMLIQVVCRYAHRSMDDQIWTRRSVRRKGSGWTVFNTTKEQHIETLNAWDVLRPLYKKERKRLQKAILYAFLEKHNLYYQPASDELSKLRSQNEQDPDEDARRAGQSLEHLMEDAEITKRLGESQE